MSAFGRVGHEVGFSDRPSISITGTGAYATGQCIGGAQTLAPYRTLVSDITLVCILSTGFQLDILFFDQAPVAGFADKAAITGSLRMAGATYLAQVASGDWIVFGAEMMVTKGNLALFANPLKAFALIARAAVTLNGVDQIIVKLGLSRDR